MEIKHKCTFNKIKRTYFLQGYGLQIKTLKDESFVSGSKQVMQIFLNTIPLNDICE